MGSELDLTLLDGIPIALALILDGRESVAVPTWRVNNGPLQKFHALPYGPLVMRNTDMEAELGTSVSIRIYESDDPLAIAKRVAGVSGPVCENRDIEIGARSTITIMPHRPYLCLAGGNSTIKLQPAGILTRGPSSMPVQAPMAIGSMPN